MVWSAEGSGCLVISMFGASSASDRGLVAVESRIVTSSEEPILSKKVKSLGTEVAARVLLVNCLITNLLQLLGLNLSS